MNGLFWNGAVFTWNADFQFAPKRLTFSNWVLTEIFLFLILPWINCNWTPVFQSHLPNSPWFPI
jgi:hypothetical protein